MLRPQDNAARERKNLSGLWRFSLDVAGEGRDERWYADGLADAGYMAVPASYNDIITDAAVRDHMGDAWYQTTVRVPRGWAGRRIVLHFESATHRRDRVGRRHRGRQPRGRLHAVRGRHHRHVAPPATRPGSPSSVNNELSFQTIPPGIVEDTPPAAGSGTSTTSTTTPGLHRSVWLSSTPAAHVDDVTVGTGLDGTAGIVDYTVVGRRRAPGAGRASCCATPPAARWPPAEGDAGTLRVADAHLWAPGDGYLYDLEVAAGRPGGELVDSYHQTRRHPHRRGRRHPFLINGEPFYFTGFGKHEDIAVVGKGHNDAYLVHDFELLDWIGANSFRTSHYPYSEEVSTTPTGWASSSSTRPRPSG